MRSNSALKKIQADEISFISTVVIINYSSLFITWYHLYHL